MSRFAGENILNLFFSALTRLLRNYGNWPWMEVFGAIKLSNFWDTSRLTKYLEVMTLDLPDTTLDSSCEHGLLKGLLCDT
jgi:hypothetical protein